MVKSHTNCSDQSTVVSLNTGEDIETEHSHNFYSIKFNTSVYLLLIAFFDSCIMKALIAHI